MHCPHCDVALPAAWARERAGRCPTCRLVVGAGRATDSPGGSTTISGAGTAAGILGGAARRQDAAPGDPTLVAEALREAARRRGVEYGRLRMLDYQQVVEQDPSLPDLGVVLATFGTWKAARAQPAALAPPALESVGARAATG